MTTDKINNIVQIGIKEIIKYNYIAFFDCEFTCREDSIMNNWSDPEFPPEILQIGIIIFNANVSQMIDSYSSYAKPIKNYKLTNYCTNLLNISQETIDSAENFQIVSKNITSFLRNYRQSDLLTCSWGIEDRFFTTLTSKMNYCNDPFDNFDYLDLQRRSAECINHINPDIASREDIRKTFKIQKNKYTHNALDDAEDLIEIFKYIQNNYV